MFELCWLDYVLRHSTAQIGNRGYVLENVTQTKANTHTSGKKPIMFVTDDGASRGTMLYGISSPLKAASDLFIFLI